MLAVLEIVIGLITVFLVFSIVVSGINEWLAQRFARRGEFLRLGLQRLMSDRTIYDRLLHHPLIGSLYRERAAKGKPPSYIDPANFAMAITDVLIARARVSQVNRAGGDPPLTIETLRAALRAPALATSPVAMSLAPIVDRAGADLTAALQGIQAWFDAGMDRVSGWYKTRTRVLLFWLGLGLAALCNIDAIEIAAALNASPALRGTLVQTASQISETGKVGDVVISNLQDRPPTDTEWRSMKPVLEGLRGAGGTLPIGYACLGAPFSLPDAAVEREINTNGQTMQQGTKQRSVWVACLEQAREAVTSGSPANGVLKLLGWILTAGAGTLGAGYWFGLLTKAINIRGTGPKPEAKPS
jgi:hypothetical protein